MFSYMSLESYFKLIFALQQFHKWQISDVENMMPFERDIYVMLLNQHIEEEKNKNKNND